MNEGQEECERASDYGRGTTYCLALFLMHAHKYFEYKEMYEKSGIKQYPGMLFFNGSSDHLLELQSAPIKDKKIRDRLRVFADKCIHWGHGLPDQPATEADVIWALDEAKMLLRMIDANLLKVDVSRGEFE